jgi:hypothetical protein
MNQLTLFQDGRKPSVLDKIRARYLEGRKLSEKQEKKRIQYEQAHALRLQGYSREQTVKMLVSLNIAGSIQQAYRIVSASEQLFGEVNKVHKDGLRHILTENLQRIYNRAMETGNLKEANKSLVAIAEINNLKETQINPFDYKTLIIPVPVYTTDADVLRKQETVDIPHEDAE